MIRKIKREMARKNMRDQEISIFKKYARGTTRVFDKRKNKFVEKSMMKSFFARSWRAWVKL